jgi:hypothetical protein
LRGIRFSLEALLGLVLLGVMLTGLWQQVRLGDVVLTASILAPNSEVTAIRGLGADFQHRWFGSPALWQSPPIDNTDIGFFEVRGRTQRELIASLVAADICKTHGPCTPDPASPSGVALGLEGVTPAVTSYVCYAPSRTTVPYREQVWLPRWSPLPIGGVSISLVEAWNALAKMVYVHEAGHVAIDIQAVNALNAQAHRLSSCQAVFDFWDSPHVWDQRDADQNAYHARLRADCRPEIGCAPAGWMGW